MKICGIYEVINPKGHIYIGQSINIIRRWDEYKNLNGYGSNTRLYRSLKKYGYNKHKFEILEQCLSEELNDKEIYYIELYQCFNSKFGMNLHSGGNNHTITEETRDKLRVSHLGQKAWNKGIPRTDEEKLAHSIKMKGKKLSKEHKNKISEGSKGHIVTAETREKIREKHIGVKMTVPAWNKGLKGYLSEQAKKRMSDASKGRTGDKNSFYGKHHSNETKQKISNANKK